ncbi:YebC/PmpR family DNA-binding transcriptional regulator [Risungbinella massiliensis]|uniref:YebC/PmpR family DNA-binding transcriptional regulator n=1 Tax=Risungbinella massiliensis TaxID=1329796 RepID=UPI0005CBB44A|nr:YebC/PmpR family DNA-binding transcriptional regulator [Risungbinella massiliensis]
MAGHSKWKNIQHRKGRQDAIKGKMFAKLAKEIYVAAKAGDPDPANNQRLRLAISKAKQNNMPNDNIDRAIKKAAGSGADDQFESITYEGYGPGGIAVMVECLTDNRNRSAADVRHIFSKRGGNLGENGCVSYLFERKGYLLIDSVLSDEAEEELLLEALEMGAEDVESTEKGIEITSSPEEFEELREGLEAKGYTFAEAEVTLVPETKIMIEGEQLQAIFNLIDALEDHDDVQNVYTNFDATEEEIAKVME